MSKKDIIKKVGCPKGTKRSKEIIEKRLKSMAGYRHSEETKQKIREGHLDKIVSEETKRKMSESHIGIKRPPISEETRRKMSESRKGEKSYLWKGGVASENMKVRSGIEYRLWREAVFARDNWTCQKTGIKGGMLEAHHIQNFSDFSELRFAIDNGITLSKKSHREFHRKYGTYNNTQAQLEEFVNEINDKFLK